MEKQYDKRKCKLCFNIVARINEGKFPSARDKKYVDLNGSLWNGSKCPSCVRLISRSRYKRKTPKAPIDPEDING